MAFDQTTVDAIASEARRHGIEPAAALAIADVESGGVAFALVDGRKEPLIRFEGHYFDKRLTKAQQAKARAAGLSAPKAGAVKNPVKQSERWKVLNRAIEINANAALESCSWGLGQVMGSHWAWLGFGSVTELVNTCRRDVGGQADVMFRFVDKSGLSKALAARDWKAFAKGYNGPAYAKNAYDTKMAAAYKRWAKRLEKIPASTAPKASNPKPLPVEKPPLSTAPEPAVETVVLPPAPPVPVAPATFTDKTTVATVQARLWELGYTEVGSRRPDGEFDGKIGSMTAGAILAFRRDNGLELVDYIDGNLIESLARAKPRVIAPERAEAPPAVVREKVPEVKANWMTKIGAWVVGIPSFFLALGDGILSNLTGALGYIQPVKDTFDGVPGWVWFLLVAIAAAVLWRVARHGEAKGTEAFQTGARR